MRSNIPPKLVLVAGACLVLAGCIVAPPPPPPHPHAAVVAVAPPPPQYEVVPAPGRPEVEVWDPGHWRWDGRAYVWDAGHYVERPARGATWVPGHWDQRHGGYVWEEGHWR